MIFQAKWRNFSVMIRRSYYQYENDGSRHLVPGLVADFRGPQRLFDSEREAEKNGWSKEDREFVEKKLVSNKRFGNGIYPAPGQEIPERLIKFSNWTPPKKKLLCQYIWPEDGTLKQCRNEPTAGREFCADHDPREAQIISGGLTTQNG